MKKVPCSFIRYLIGTNLFVCIFIFIQIYLDLINVINALTFIRETESVSRTNTSFFLFFFCMVEQSIALETIFKWINIFFSTTITNTPFRFKLPTRGVKVNPAFVVDRRWWLMAPS